VIGAPFGLSHTLTVGHLSARHTPGTMVGPHNLAEFFQVDAAINRGNSGGPVFDMDGEVIGIVSYILSRSGTFEGVGFAVTTNSIRDLLLSRRMPWSGISVFALDRTMARLFNLPQNGGLLVQQVARGSPGAKLGLVPGYVPARIGDYELLIGGDVILSVDGIEVDGDGGDTYRKLRAHLAEVPTGGTVTVRVMRHGRIIDLATVRED
jgi:serine protease Do